MPKKLFIITLCFITFSITPAKLPQVPQSIQNQWNSLQGYVSAKVSQNLSPESQAWLKYHGTQAAAGMGVGLVSDGLSHSVMSISPRLAHCISLATVGSVLVVPEKVNAMKSLQAYAEKNRETGRWAYMTGRWGYAYLGCIIFGE